MKYKVEELKPGMRVSFSELSNINEVTLFFKASTMDYSTGDPSGVLVSINYTAECDNYEPEELVAITNHDDEDYYSMDDFYED